MKVCTDERMIMKKKRDTVTRTRVIQLGMFGVPDVEVKEMLNKVTFHDVIGKDFVAKWADLGDLVPVSCACQLLKVSRIRVHQLIKRGVLKAVKLNGVMYIGTHGIVARMKNKPLPGRPRTN